MPGHFLQSDEVLRHNEQIVSLDGRCTLIMQGDGNLVLYFPGFQAVWSSKTSGSDVAYCIMQGDGNLVLYNASGIPRWASATDRHPGATLVMQDDGNLVIYAASGTPLWSSGTNWLQPKPVFSKGTGNRLNPNEGLASNDSLISANGRFRFIMQGDGNLVLYVPNGNALWDSHTDHTDAWCAVMQGDGNFVMYSIKGEYKWDSGTDGHPGAFLVVQDDGNVVIYDVNGEALWATNTVTKLTVNLSYKILVHPVTGKLADYDIIGHVHDCVQQMNDLCNVLNTNFRFRLAEAPVAIGGPDASGQVNVWFNTPIMGEHMQPFEKSAKLLPAEFAWRTDAVNIYMTGKGWGGRSSFPGNGELVTIAADVNLLGVHHTIHELGHYFGLFHTHEGHGGLPDILVDDPKWDMDEIARQNFSKDFAQLSMDEQQLVQNTFSNIMSYHGSATNPLRIFTKSQLDKWELEMRTSRSHVTA